jgi:hypothetical protein
MWEELPLPTAEHQNSSPETSHCRGFVVVKLRLVRHIVSAEDPRNGAVSDVTIGHHVFTVARITTITCSYFFQI